MAGHSKWAQIKHKKGAADAKRGKLFSKLSMAISIAAKDDPNPETNIKLRAAIDKAKSNNMPSANIERAVKRVTEAKEHIDEVLIEAYGPEGVALYIIGVTDNTNRTMAEVKSLMKDYDTKVGEPGSALWAFTVEGATVTPKFLQQISEPAAKKLSQLTEELEERDDIQEVWTNASS